MTPEPLKKGQYHSEGSSLTECDFPEGFYYEQENIKSAVKGCLEEIEIELSEFPPSLSRDKVKKIFKKWFEDVM